MIPKDQCKHGYVYRIHSHNLIVGVYDSKDGSFVGIREKLRGRYLFPEYHHDNGAPYGTVRPIRKIEKCPVSDIRAYLGSICKNCQRRVDWKRTDPKKVIGVWFHLDPTDCQDPKPVAQRNLKLFRYLEGVEKRVEEEEGGSTKPASRPSSKL